MLAWVVVGVAAVVGVCATTAALFAGGHLRRPRVAQPEWTLPAPVDLRAARFPLAWRGYDPAHVDVYLDAVSAAYEALYVAARPAARSQAEERLVARPEPDAGGAGQVHGDDGDVS